MDFFVGTHEPHWLARAGYPLFVSYRRLTRRPMGMPRAIAPWALDSGGFTEIKMYGKWTTPPEQYVRDVRRYRDEIGQLQWASPQDWMCEPFMLAKTGYDVEAHQLLTVENYCDLMMMAPDLPWTPVLQGWERDDYLRHIDMYDRFGIDLRQAPMVGVGSVCRRQHTDQAADIFRAIHGAGLHKLHGFGVKTSGLTAYAPFLASADSMSWSFMARYRPPLPGCTHKQCQNCLRWASTWRRQILTLIP